MQDTLPVAISDDLIFFKQKLVYINRKVDGQLY